MAGILPRKIEMDVGVLAWIIRRYVLPVNRKRNSATFVHLAGDANTTGLSSARSIPST